MSVPANPVNPERPEQDNIVPVRHQVTADERAARTSHYGAVLWFTGLPGSGKSTLAMALERRLFDLSLAGLHARRRQHPPRLERGPGVLAARPGREHPARRRGGRALRRCRRNLHRRVHLTVPGRPGARARRGRRASLFRGVREIGALDLRAPRPERSLSPRARRRDQGFHRRRRALRSAGTARDRHRHRDAGYRSLRRRSCWRSSWRAAARKGPRRDVPPRTPPMSGLWAFVPACRTRRWAAS